MKDEYVIERQERFQNKVLKHTDVSYQPVGIIIKPINDDLCSLELVPPQNENYQVSTDLIEELRQKRIIRLKE